jgi:hypothetical protein
VAEARKSLLIETIVVSDDAPDKEVVLQLSMNTVPTWCVDVVPGGRTICPSNGSLVGKVLFTISDGLPKLPYHRTFRAGRIIRYCQAQRPRNVVQCVRTEAKRPTDDPMSVLLSPNMNRPLLFALQPDITYAFSYISHPPKADSRVLTPML